MSERHSYDLGIVGNCNYIAYIDTKADVKWLCWPRFDSSFVLGGLLDKEKGGYFYIQPAALEEYTSVQSYDTNTNILITEFSNDAHAFRVIDFAPRFELYGRYFKPLMLFRKLEIIRGRPEIRVGCKPTYDYGQRALETNHGSNHLRFLGSPEPMRLTTNASMTYLMQEKSFFTSESLYFVLSYGAPLEAPLEDTFEEFLKKTKNYWRNWIVRASIPAVFQKEAIRSALVLKLHGYEDTGAIIASGTTSLPEHDQSGRNWDYRYCWPRDTYYTLKAFTLISHFSEMESYVHFMQNLITEGRHLQPVFGIDGREDLTESSLDLEGYLGNQPVRIGNQAYRQIQNDIYGQILLSLLPQYIDERLVYPDRLLDFDMIRHLINKIEETIDLPDAGIWEFRGCNETHVHTQLFHWVGCKVVKKIAERYGKDDLANLATTLIERAAEHIEGAYDEKRKCYRAAKESDYLDASTLLLINLNYLDPNSQKAKDHVKGIYSELKSENGLLYRYRKQDDFGDTRSSFLVCTFWYIEALINIGETDQACALLHKALDSGNHLGLLSEDVSGEELSQWGNFPQTYSHVGLINCAYKLDRKLDRQDFETP